MSLTETPESSRALNFRRKWTVGAQRGWISRSTERDEEARSGIAFMAIARSISRSPQSDPLRRRRPRANSSSSTSGGTFSGTRSPPGAHGSAFAARTGLTAPHAQQGTGPTSIFAWQATPTSVSFFCPTAPRPRSTRFWTRTPSTASFQVPSLPPARTAPVRPGAPRTCMPSTPRRSSTTRFTTPLPRARPARTRFCTGTPATRGCWDRRRERVPSTASFQPPEPRRPPPLQLVQPIKDYATGPWGRPAVLRRPWSSCSRSSSTP